MVRTTALAVRLRLAVCLRCGAGDELAVALFLSGYLAVCCGYSIPCAGFISARARDRCLRRTAQAAAKGGVRGARRAGCDG